MNKNSGTNQRVRWQNETQIDFIKDTQNDLIKRQRLANERQ